MTKLQDAVEAALANAGYMTSAWVIVAEQIDDDGSAYLVHEISPNLPDWTRVGMLYGALDMGPYLYDEESQTD